ncbi:MAG: tRNA pseudouridine(54/55) synthase Pus10 [Candidatus Baldrarchaeia archaeon]
MEGSAIESVVLEKALNILKRYPVCDHCLGRSFALLGTSTDNHTRGFSIKALLTLEAHRLLEEDNTKGYEILKVLAVNGNFSMARDLLKKKGKDIASEMSWKCYICGGIFQRIDKIIDDIVKEVEKYEFNTFLVGSHVDVSILEREDELRASMGLSYGESIKRELNREVGKKLQERLKKKVDFENPDIVILIRILKDFSHKIDVKVNPIFIYGRYRKLIRGIPQTTWTCKKCGGRGCEECSWTGKRHKESVEELIITPILEITKGEEAVFHGAGREDLDARMLGNGRPFIVEIKAPLKRFISLEDLERHVNNYAKGKIEVGKLRWVKREDVRKLKALSQIAAKVYRVLVETEKPVSEAELKELEQMLTGVTVRQRTPLRVAYRRADKVRIKAIYHVKTKRLDDNHFEMVIKCQGGLYVKELVSGDEGRTVPSVAEILGTQAKCIELDVLDVESPT